MKEKWQSLEQQFQSITPREQYLIILTGLFVIMFALFNFVIDENLQTITKQKNNIKNTQTAIQSKKTTINVLEEALQTDPNQSVNQQIKTYQQLMSDVDTNLMLLASDLINPVQMRYALSDVLTANRKVSLLSFEMFEPLPVDLGSKAASNANDGAPETVQPQTLMLYKHGIKLTLSGSYFELHDYLAQLEQLKWKFFWQRFNYEITGYPDAELVIEMYSLSTKKEFIGV